MEEVTRYQFRPVTPSDFEMLAAWQSKPHVREWWGNDDPVGDDELADMRVSRWIVSCDGCPFAYMQDYTVHGWGEIHHFAHLPIGSRGIDQFIGLSDWVGCGHGPAFIRERVQQLFLSGVPVVATDPDPTNARAIAAYRKAGFEVFGPAQDTQWGRILPMKVSARE